jgi:hypothetical protein
LRRAGAAVEYALRPQTLGKQRKAAFSAGATYFVTLAPDFRNTGALEIDEVQHVEGAGGGLIDQLAQSPRTLPNLIRVFRGS